nr:MAG TPA: hypothetical protein [Bacteriophage sp.]
MKVLLNTKLRIYQIYKIIIRGFNPLFYFI